MQGDFDNIPQKDVFILYPAKRDFLRLHNDDQPWRRIEQLMLFQSYRRLNFFVLLFFENQTNLLLTDIRN
jgi:hypothetical protein